MKPADLHTGQDDSNEAGQARLAKPIPLAHASILSPSFSSGMVDAAHAKISSSGFVQF